MECGVTVTQQPLTLLSQVQPLSSQFFFVAHGFWYPGPLLDPAELGADLLIPAVDPRIKPPGTRTLTTKVLLNNP